MATDPFKLSLLEAIKAYGSSEVYKDLVYLEIHLYLYDRRIVITGLLLGDDGELFFEYDNGMRNWVAPAGSEPLWVLRDAVDYIRYHFNG